MMSRFDVVVQPWLPVIRLNGQSDTVGLRGLLAEAHQLRRILGETPAMTAALYRLVLAFAHRVFGPATSQEWDALWKGEAFPAQEVDAYVARYSDRFDLFDAQHPFLQCPELSTVGRSSAAKLVPHMSSGNNTTLFDHTTADDKVVLTAAEAARWLVTLHSWDPGGLKTPYTREKSSERAPCNGFGVVLVEGNTLKETLVLNMLVYSPRDRLPRGTGPGDMPVWEAQRPPSPEPGARRDPAGWTDLLTWPSRRVLLSCADTAEPAVDGVVITPGTKGSKDSPFHVEGMAAFHWPKATKAAGHTSLSRFPIRLEVRRGIWRHAQELLLENPQGSRPRTLTNLSEMVEEKYVAANAVYTLRVFGQQLDKDASVVQATMEDAVAAPVALLRAKDPRVGDIIGLAIKLADDAGMALRRLERDYCTQFRAAPGAGIELRYWPDLPQPFGRFLHQLADSLGEGVSEWPASEAWAAEVKKVATASARCWTEATHPNGRSVMVAGQVHGRFLGAFEGLKSTYASQVAALINIGEKP